MVVILCRNREVNELTQHRMKKGIMEKEIILSHGIEEKMKNITKINLYFESKPRLIENNRTHSLTTV